MRERERERRKVRFLFFFLRYLSKKGEFLLLSFLLSWEVKEKGWNGEGRRFSSFEPFLSLPPSLSLVFFSVSLSLNLSYISRSLSLSLSFNLSSWVCVSISLSLSSFGVHPMVTLSLFQSLFHPMVSLSLNQSLFHHPMVFLPFHPSVRYVRDKHRQKLTSTFPKPSKYLGKKRGSQTINHRRRRKRDSDLLLFLFDASEGKKER